MRRLLCFLGRHKMPKPAWYERRGATFKVCLACGKRVLHWYGPQPGLL